MVKVYFGSGRHAELVAIFDNEETYDLCADVLKKQAEENRMFVTESCDEKNIDDVDY